MNVSSLHTASSFDWRSEAVRAYAERPGSATPRQGHLPWNRDAIAGFAASGWFGDLIVSTPSQVCPAT